MRVPDPLMSGLKLMEKQMDMIIITKSCINNSRQGGIDSLILYIYGFSKRLTVNMLVTYGQ